MRFIKVSLFYRISLHAAVWLMLISVWWCIIRSLHFDYFSNLNTPLYWEFFYYAAVRLMLATVWWCWLTDTNTTLQWEIFLCFSISDWSQLMLGSVWYAETLTQTYQYHYSGESSYCDESFTQTQCTTILLMLPISFWYQFDNAESMTHHYTEKSFFMLLWCSCWYQSGNAK